MKLEKGTSGNPSGRPTGARNKLGEALLRDLATSWDRDGAAVLQRLIADDPATYANIVAKVLPRDIAVSVEQRLPGNLNTQQSGAVNAVIAAVEAAGAQGVAIEQVAEWITEDLRARMAKQLPEVEVLALPEPAPSVIPPGPIPPPEEDAPSSQHPRFTRKFTAFDQCRPRPFKATYKLRSRLLNSAQILAKSCSSSPLANDAGSRSGTGSRGKATRTHRARGARQIGHESTGSGQRRPHSWQPSQSGSGHKIWQAIETL